MVEANINKLTLVLCFSFYDIMGMHESPWIPQFWEGGVSGPVRLRARFWTLINLSREIPSGLSLLAASLLLQATTFWCLQLTLMTLMKNLLFGLKLDCFYRLLDNNRDEVSVYTWFPETLWMAAHFLMFSQAFNQQTCFELYNKEI